MLKPKVISQVLRQSTRNGVKASLLMTQDGSLLSYATDHDKNVKIYAAITANLWSTYHKQTATESFFDSDDSQHSKFLLLDCEARLLNLGQEGSVFILGVGTMLLCLVAEKSVPLGILKAKAEALKDHLEEPLLRLAAYQD